MKIHIYTWFLFILVSLFYACTSKEERYKKQVQQYYDAYYQKRDINAIKPLFSSGVQYYDDKYKMPLDTFTLVLDFDKKLQAKAHIANMSVHTDTVIVTEKLTDDLDALLSRPSAQYKKRFIFKDNKILQVVSLPHNQEEWAKKYLDRMQAFFIWLRETYPKDFPVLANEPYTHADLMLTYAKEYAKQSK